MSRAINIDASRTDVLKMCNKHELRISAIESLAPAGTRVTLCDPDDAAILESAFAGRVLSGSVAGDPVRLR